MYCPDFYCHEARLSIELDGGGHNDPEKKHQDKERTVFLESAGIKVIAFGIMMFYGKLRWCWSSCILSSSRPFPKRRRGERSVPLSLDCPHPVSQGERGRPLETDAVVAMPLVKQGLCRT